MSKKCIHTTDITRARAGDVKAFFSKFGRVYIPRVPETLDGVGYNMLSDHPALAAALITSGSGLLSLTSHIGYSRVLVRRNEAVSEDLVSLRDVFLERANDVKRELDLPESFQVESAMKIGTAVHRVAELFLTERLSWEECIRTAEDEAGWAKGAQDWAAFRGYLRALEDALSMGVLTPPHVLAEVTYTSEKWAGTADAVTHREVIDWKSGRSLSAAAAIMQAVVLAERAGRSVAVVVHLAQDGVARLAEFRAEDEIWDMALRLFNHALDLSQERLERDILRLFPYWDRTGREYKSAESIMEGVNKGWFSLPTEPTNKTLIGVPAVEDGSIAPAPW